MRYQSLICLWRPTAVFYVHILFTGSYSLSYSLSPEIMTSREVTLKTQAAYPRENPVQTLCPGVVFKCKHSLAPAYLSEQLQQVAQLESRQRLRSSSSQRSSCQGPEGRRSVTDLSLLPAPGHGIVCRPLSLRRPLCHHSVDT